MSFHPLDAMLLSQYRAWGRLFVSSTLPVLLLLHAPHVGAQELPLKRALAAEDSRVCPPPEASDAPGPEAQEQARRLGLSADQALILGDRERASDLLARATELDPTSSALRYRYARVLEDLGRGGEALSQFCGVVGLGEDGPETRDALARLEGLREDGSGGIPSGARDPFKAGVSAADAGRLNTARWYFQAAVREAPEWADAVYNLGVIRVRTQQVRLGLADLQRYLSLRPDASDAVHVAERIEALREYEALPRPATALGLGLVLPGGGQLYSGRAWSGVVVLAVAGAAVATGFLVEEARVRCAGATGPQASCPPDLVIAETQVKPYRDGGLVAAGAVMLLGAVESFFWARGARDRALRPPGDLDVAGPRLEEIRPTPVGPRVRLSLVRVGF